MRDKITLCSATAGCITTTSPRCRETMAFNPVTVAAAGKITNWTFPAGPRLNFTHDSSGNLQSVANQATLQRLNFHYATGQLLSVDDNTGRTVGYGYDAQKNLRTFV